MQTNSLEIVDDSEEFDSNSDSDDQETSSKNYLTETPTSLEDIGNAVMYSTDWTTDTLVNNIRKNRIDLSPKFQRRDAWGPERKSRYIESLMLGFPTPNITLAKNKDGNSNFLVIDGKQRLLSIMQFFASSSNSDFKSLKLTGLNILTQLNSCDFEKVKSIENGKWIDKLEVSTTRSHVISNWPNEQFLYQLFLRINQGSMPLSPQELRASLHPGPLNEFLENAASKHLFKGMRTSGQSKRMQDLDLVLRLIAFNLNLNNYNGNLKEFLDAFTVDINKNWGNWETRLQNSVNEIEKAIQFSNEVFAINAFRRFNKNIYNSTFNRSVADVQIYFFSIENVRKNCIGKEKEIEIKFKELSRNGDFIDSISANTNSLISIKKRFTLWASALSEISDFFIESPKIGYL